MAVNVSVQHNGGFLPGTILLTAMLLPSGNPLKCHGEALYQKLMLLFLTFSALVANPKKLLYTVANPAHGLLNKAEKKLKKSLAAPPPPPPPRARCSFGEKNKKIKNHATHPHI